MKKKSHILILMVLLLFIYPSISFSKTIDETKQYASELALKSAIQKELFEIITEDTNEMLKNDLESGVIKNLNKTVKNEFIFNFVNKICLLEKLKKCPDIYSTTKENISVAAMYPTGFMLISEESLNNLNENEFYFVLAHEMAHLIHKDSLNKTIFAANSMIDNDMMIATEKIVYYLFLIPGVKEFQRNVESNADRYAMNFLIKENIEFNCEKIFKTILKDKIEFTDFHDNFNNRCEKLH